jgi:tetratricopeptide (TPR) repeat protein
MADNPRIEELKRRVQADPASIAFAALAEEYRRAGQFTEAIETCRAGLARHPAYLSARVTLGRALIEVEALDEAKEELDYVLRIAPENLAAIRAMAEIHHRRGQAPEAAQQYRSAVEIAAHRQQPSAEATQPLRPATPPVAAAAPPVDDPVVARLQQFLSSIVAARRSRAAQAELDQI